MKKSRNLRLLLTTLAVFFLAFCTSSCIINSDSKKERVKGTGDKIERTISIDPFTKLSIEGQANISVSYGATQEIKVKAQKNILELLEFTINEGTLTVGTKNNYEIKESKGIDIEIVTPDAITHYDISGAADLFISGKPQEHLNISIAGAADVKAFELPVNDLNVSIAGAGDCEVNAIKNLKVSIAGTGSITYKGDPQISKSIAGLGSIKKSE